MKITHNPLEKENECKYQTQLSLKFFLCCMDISDALQIPRLKVKTSFGNAPLSKNEMEALITNHLKEYVLTNT